MIKHKKPPLTIRHIRKPQGRCYELAGRAVNAVENETGRLVLVHGEYPRLVGRGTYAHAWVLDTADDTIFDTTQRRWYRAAEYPGVERVRYTHKEQSRLIAETGSFGPYEPDLIVLALS
jgi:hypothetical protein